MGRGGRILQTLALAPLPAPEQDWLAAFTAFEHGEFHELGLQACTIPFPSGAPRFILIAATNLPPDPHTFQYYTTAQDLLGALILLVRTLGTAAPFGYRVIEYVSGSFKIIAYSSDVVAGAIKCEAHVCVRQVSSEPIASRSGKRINHALAVATAHDQPILSAYSGVERFLILLRSSVSELSLRPIELFEEVEEWIGYMSLHPTAFVALYDLDVSDQPVPVRLGLKYTDSLGVTYELFES